MKNGIGPQNLGASGMNPKSTPCGHSTITSPSGSPLNFQDDINKIQEAVSTLEHHKIGGGGGEVQGAAAAAKETAASQMGQARQSMAGLFGGLKQSLANASGGLGRMVSRMGARGIV